MWQLNYMIKHFSCTWKVSWLEWWRKQPDLTIHKCDDCWGSLWQFCVAAGGSCAALSCTVRTMKLCGTVASLWKLPLLMAKNRVCWWYCGPCTFHYWEVGSKANCSALYAVGIPGESFLMLWSKLHCWFVQRWNILNYGTLEGEKWWLQVDENLSKFRTQFTTKLALSVCVL